MSVGPGAMGLLWLWAIVAELGPGEHPEPQSRPAPDRHHDLPGP
jgi:hypothetical protein